MFSGGSTYKGTDPEQGVGGESVTSGMIEPLDSRDQARLTSSFPVLASHALTFSMQLWSTRFRAMRSVQAYTRDALQLHRYSPVAPSHVRVGW
jgi:hypothetical protein